MTCDVCGREMRQASTTSRLEREAWLCHWCYAWTFLGLHEDEVSRPQYQPVHPRWERADSDGLPDDVAHAYGVAGTTLCGVEGSGISPSPYPWVPGWGSACLDCKDAAAIIDGRWPTDSQGVKYERAMMPRAANPDRPPF